VTVAVLRLSKKRKKKKAKFSFVDRHFSNNNKPHPIFENITLVSRCFAAIGEDKCDVILTVALTTVMP
jgi:hypothetical protein